MIRILFVCVENSCRSQMAEAFARRLGRDLMDAYSAGSSPSGKVNPKAIQVMKELGIDISSTKSKGFKDLPFKNFDLVITLGCKDVCPFVPAEEHIEWNIEDPKARELAFFRKTRDKIKDKVKELIKELSAKEFAGKRG